MKPDPTRFLETTMQRLMADVVPHLEPAYRRTGLSLEAAMLLCVREELDRAASRRVEENAALRALFAEAAPHVDDAALRQDLEEAARGEDPSLLVPDLEGANLHTALGMSAPSTSLADYVADRERDLRRLLLDTPVPGLRLIAATHGNLDSAQPKSWSRVTMLQQIRELPADSIPEEARPPGVRLMSRDKKGRRRPVLVREVKEDTVVVDLNHPLAGQTLHFVVKVVAIE